MDDALKERGRSLEEMFFKQRDAELIAQRKKLAEMSQTRESLAQISGIKNPQVLDKLIESGITASTLASLSLLPLVEVAWADGQLSEPEKKAVLTAAAKGGLTQGSVNYQLLENWLKERPAAKLLDAWVHYIRGLRDVLNPQELRGVKSDLLSRARAVAEAAGGFMGVSKISPEEQAVFKKMEDAFA